MSYVGLTRRLIGKRFANHLCQAKFYFGHAIKKYGIENFDIVQIDTAETPEELGRKEAFWIKELNTLHPNGYNLTTGGEGGYTRHPESNRKISVARLAFWQTPQGLQEKADLAARRTLEGNSEEVRQKISAALKGKPGHEGNKTPWTLEQKEERKENIERLKLVNVGRIRTAEARAACSEGQKKLASQPDYVNPMKGKKRPDLAERNKSAAAKSQSQQNGLANKGKRKGVAFTPKHRAAIQATFDRKKQERQLAAQQLLEEQRAQAERCEVLRSTREREAGLLESPTLSFVEWPSVEMFGIPAWMEPAPPIGQMSLF